MTLPIQLKSILLFDNNDSKRTKGRLTAPNLRWSVTALVHEYQFLENELFLKPEKITSEISLKPHCRKLTVFKKYENVISSYARLRSSFKFGIYIYFQEIVITR